MAKESDKTLVKNQSHPNSQPSDGEDLDKKDAPHKKKEAPKPSEDVSELETFWRYYIA